MRFRTIAAVAIKFTEMKMNHNYTRATPTKLLLRLAVAGIPWEHANSQHV